MLVSLHIIKINVMNKRYEIYKNGEYINQVDTMVEMYKMLGITKQHYNKSLKGLFIFIYKNDNYQIKDKLN
jgi:hypothetical protein